MNLHIRPIVSALLRNRTGAVLVALQVAIALAVLVNALFIVITRMEKMGRPTGMDVANIFVIQSQGFTQHYDLKSSVQEDLTYLRGLPGVIAATPINAIPLSGGGSSTTLSTVPGKHNPHSYGLFEVDEQGLDALGVHLIAGRNFRHGEIEPPITSNDSSRFVASIIVSRALAEELFGKENPLGKQVYDNIGQHATVIGVVDPAMNSWPGNEHAEWVFYMPRLTSALYGGVRYMVRTRPGQRDAVMRLAETHLSKSNPERVVHFVRPLSYFKDLSYLGDRSMGIYLLTVTGLLIAVTSLGIFALATFNVATRTKQIGTRRAVGARRADIVQYFLVENGMITSAGILLGCALALGTGYWLSVQYALPRLNLYFLVGGVLVLWAIGQLAAWQPARRAAAVSPSVATRTV
ncbi:MAG TPA: FtsX-like permease family protein [Steroidobacteraceae bacterium]|jgi:putative ABC transport system permease protein|nr:FtsX-like permease family protein [Steroidobacteraceae bacterium]